MKFKFKNLNAGQKRKLLLILRIILLTAAVFYLIFIFYNNYLAETGYEIYFSTEDASYLKAENRELDEEKDIYIQIFEELKAGPKTEELNETIPPGSQLIDYQLEAGLLILNFNFEFKENHWGGSTGELLTVYSIVNSYTALSEVDSVKIIIEGEELESLAGHLDLSQPLMYNQKLIEGS